MRNRQKAAALTVLCAACGGGAHAQPGPDSPLIIDRGRVDRAAPPPAMREPAPAEPSVAAQVDAEGDQGTPISRIEFNPARVPEPVARAAEGFVGKPASRALLGRLAAAMSDAYAKADIALYTVQIPAQDLSSGTVHVTAIEGFIENVVINGDTEERQIDLIKAYATALANEQPLSRHRLERYISLIRDVPGLVTEVQLLRGQKPGGVVLVLTLKFKKSRLTGGVDNRGTRLLGDGQLSATATLYRLFREGDETSIVGAGAIDFKRYRYAAISHSTPVGTDGVRLSLSGAYLTTQPRHSLIRGNAKTAGVTLSYPVIRGYKTNLVASASIDGINSDNAALGTLIATERTRAARLALGYSQVETKSVLSLGTSVSRGIDMLGTRVTAPLSDPTFTKFTARASYDRQVAKRWIGRVRATGQHSSDPLPAAERLVAGGADYGRAFDAAILTGDRGYAGLAELAWRPDVPARWIGSELYGFVDGARLHVLRRDPFPSASYDLASAGGGARISFVKKATLELELARAVDRPYPGYHGIWRVSVGWKYDL